MLSFWLKNVAIGVWVVVMGVVSGAGGYRERAEYEGGEELVAA